MLLIIIRKEASDENVLQSIVSLYDDWHTFFADHIFNNLEVYNSNSIGVLFFRKQDVNLAHFPPEMTSWLRIFKH